jgi:thiol-disulfide isomerase/thioredoxin
MKMSVLLFGLMVFGIFALLTFVLPTALSGDVPAALTAASSVGRAAPDFVGITDWIQTDPLSIAKLRGKVVIVHFWTNGCINCQHNYPHYREWAKEFAGKDVVIVGVHTPEFDWEADVKRIRDQAKSNNLTFPIAVDTDGETWRAWHNKYWPAIYVVDKKGNIRFDWSGELTSGGNKGNAIVRQKVNELLREAP